MRDTQEELERLQKELLSEDMAETQSVDADDLLDPEFLKGVFTEPAFEDPDAIHDPEEPMVYRNFSNDYGQDLPEYRDEEPAPQGISKDDKTDMGLMIGASALCLGIIGVMVYWLVAWL